MLRDRAAFPDDCVDLIYLDPPFNSKRDYNLLFKSPKGHESEAQITAFENSCHWGEQAEREFDELVHAPNTDVSEMMQALRRFLGENDMMAYLTMMAKPPAPAPPRPQTHRLALPLTHSKKETHVSHKRLPRENRYGARDAAKRNALRILQLERAWKLEKCNGCRPKVD